MQNWKTQSISESHQPGLQQHTDTRVFTVHTASPQIFIRLFHNAAVWRSTSINLKPYVVMTFRATAKEAPSTTADMMDHREPASDTNVLPSSHGTDKEIKNPTGCSYMLWVKQERWCHILMTHNYNCAKIVNFSQAISWYLCSCQPSSPLHLPNKKK